MPLAALLAALLAAAPAPAAAPAQPAAAEARFAAGKTAFAGGEFAKALKELDAAAGLLDAADETMLAKVHLLRGQCMATLRDNAKAEDAFAKALAADPEASLDPSVVRPSVVQLLEKVRAGLRADLSVRSDERNSRASLDGKPLGPLPVKTAVAIGRHRLEVTAADGRTEAQEVVLRPLKSHEIWIKFPVASVQPPIAVAPLPTPPVTPATATVEASTASPVRPFADLRGVVEATTGNPQGEVGIGLDLVGHLLVSAHFTAGNAFGVTGRVTGSFPSVVSVVGFYASAEVPVLFVPDRTAIGLGLGLGVEFTATRWLEPFVEVSGRRFLSLPDGYRANYLMASAGARLRIP